MVVCQWNFAQKASHITLKEKSNSYSAYSYSRIQSIEHNLTLRWQKSFGNVFKEK